MTALTDLLARVEAGEASTMRFEDCGFDGWAELAYHGSLDAARALHEAVLGHVNVRMDDGSGYDTPFAQIRDDGIDFEGEAETMARAWLIAILRALIAREEA